MNTHGSSTQTLPRFDRVFFDAAETFTQIGSGSIGGKALGLARARELLVEHFPPEDSAAIRVDVPTITVLATGVFDAFMQRNDLYDVALSDLADDRIAHVFQQADLPTEILGDLKALIDQVHTPLAVRSSSLLEDAMHHPFAGVYETKMTPNNQHDPGLRFRRLVEAIKFVFASTFFRQAKGYMQAIGVDPRDEKMAVIIQEVVGARHGDRFYPTVSGVCRSFNFYPPPRARPEEGVVNLALGLGKAIVDGGMTWSYSPARPKLPPPFASVKDLLRTTQSRFWAVNMGQMNQFDPIRETEYLIHADLGDAEFDGTLTHVASTYDARSDRLSPGVGIDGPRALTFAPLLELDRFRFTHVIPKLLETCEKAYETPIEIEFAMVLPFPAGPPRPTLGFLQIRPMVVSDERVDLPDDELARPDPLVVSRRAMGNGVIENIEDVVYVRPEAFDAKHTRRIAVELERFNAELARSSRPYVLIGYGRWGSSDPWLGIPVNWAQISGAKVIVEAGLENMIVEASQGSHFFHNISSFQVCYFTVPHGARSAIAFDRLDALQSERESQFVRHVRLPAPLLIKVDGRSGRGGVWFAA